MENTLFSPVNEVVNFDGSVAPERRNFRLGFLSSSDPRSITTFNVPHANINVSDDEVIAAMDKMIAAGIIFNNRFGQLIAKRKSAQIDIEVSQKLDIDQHVLGGGE